MVMTVSATALLWAVRKGADKGAPKLISTATIVRLVARGPA